MPRAPLRPHASLRRCWHEAEAEARLAQPDEALRWRWPRSARWTSLAGAGRAGAVRAAVWHSAHAGPAGLRGRRLCSICGALRRRRMRSTRPRTPSCRSPSRSVWMCPATAPRSSPATTFSRANRRARRDSGKPVNAMSPNQPSPHAPGQADCPTIPRRTSICRKALTGKAAAPISASRTMQKARGKPPRARRRNRTACSTRCATRWPA